MPDSHFSTPGAPIRVALIDASPLFMAAMERLFAGNDALLLVGHASNGRAGLELIERLRPDAICCAVQLPLVSGVELTRAVMSRFPTPILALQARDASASAPAPETAAMLAEGAVDWMLKPAPEPPQTADFLTRVARIAKVRALTRHRARDSAETVAAPLGAALHAQKSALETMPRAAPAHAFDARPELIAIGASTGGPPVLLEILSALTPAKTPPVLCVQHIAHGFLDEMLNWLRPQCRVKIEIARDGEIAHAGTVYFPAEDHHLEISGGGRLSLSNAAPLAGHRPAVDVTFESVARHYGARALALLLTGMGADGAAGLGAIRRAGGTTWAQTPATCVVAGMPGKAIELGAATAVLAPAEMIQRLESWN